MSSFVIAAPEVLASASADLSGIGEAIREATAGAASSTTGIVPSALDEVSAAISHLFGSYGQEFQALSAQGRCSMRSLRSCCPRVGRLCGR